MNIFLIVWLIVIVVCIIEGYFYSELDPESKEYLKNRENKLKNKKTWKK